MYMYMTLEPLRSLAADVEAVSAGAKKRRSRSPLVVATLILLLRLLIDYCVEMSCLLICCMFIVAYFSCNPACAVRSALTANVSHVAGVSTVERKAASARAYNIIEYTII